MSHELPLACSPLVLIVSRLNLDHIAIEYLFMQFGAHILFTCFAADSLCNYIYVNYMVQDSA
jgi:hypothetical protein